MRNSASSGKDSKKKRRKKESTVAPSKVLIMVGNTQLIRDYVLNELKDEHNLNIQRISMLHRRTATYFKNSIMEGT
jgi:hypothetical protein